MPSIRAALLIVGLGLAACTQSADDVENVQLPAPSRDDLQAAAESSGDEADLVVQAFTTRVSAATSDEDCAALGISLEEGESPDVVLQSALASSDELLGQFYANLHAAVSSAIASCRDGADELLAESQLEIENDLALIAQRREQLGMES